MRRGDLFLVPKPSSQDPKRQRVFVVVSRQWLIDSKFSSVICAPVYSRNQGLSTQVPVGIDDGLKHDSAIHCDELISLPKSVLTRYVGTLRPEKVAQLNAATAIAVGLIPSGKSSFQ